MPVVHVHMLEGRSVAEKKAILDGIHSALVDAFRIPEDDRHQFIHEHAPDDFVSQKGPSFTLIQIVVLPGRSHEAKKKLYETITANLEREPGINRTDVLITLLEPPLENWGIRGTIGTEFEFAFDLNV
jgi:phenylpyruvate tautomerase PptA (4-oxalocrotonate tautomerase family)